VFLVRYKHYPPYVLNKRQAIDNANNCDGYINIYVTKSTEYNTVFRVKTFVERL
jgi:hypothetical protein